MKRKALTVVALRSLVLVVVVAAAWQAHAEDAKTPYPKMAPVDQYMMERSAEIAMALSAAPPSISADAEVMVMTRHGYEVAVKGKNGFVCMVERGWTAGLDDPVFWNPKIRVRSASTRPPRDSTSQSRSRRPSWYWRDGPKNRWPTALGPPSTRRSSRRSEPGAMCYMLSKQGHLNDQAGNWHPHLMFFVPDTDPEAWGAGLPGSPVVVGDKDTLDRFTLFMVPVDKWSDGTVASMDGH